MPFLFGVWTRAARVAFTYWNEWYEARIHPGSHQAIARRHAHTRSHLPTCFWKDGGNQRTSTQTLREPLRRTVTCRENPSATMKQLRPLFRIVPPWDGVKEERRGIERRLDKVGLKRQRLLLQNDFSVRTSDPECTLCPDSLLSCRASVSLKFYWKCMTSKYDMND